MPRYRGCDAFRQLQALRGCDLHRAARLTCGAGFVRFARWRRNRRWNKRPASIAPVHFILLHLLQMGNAHAHAHRDVDRDRQT